MDSEVGYIIGFVADLIAILGWLSKSNEHKNGFSLNILNSLSHKIYAYIFLSGT